MHERCGFDPAIASVAQQVDVVDLDVGRDAGGFVLQAVARADLADAYFVRPGHLGCLELSCAARSTSITLLRPYTIKPPVIATRANTEAHKANCAGHPQFVHMPRRRSTTSAIAEPPLLTMPAATTPGAGTLRMICRRPIQ